MMPASPSRDTSAGAAVTMAGKTAPNRLDSDGANSGAAQRTLMTNYALAERVFAPLTPRDARVVRRREVQHFRAGLVEAGAEPRPCWNASTQDSLHPFPQPALMHTNACYSGVDVVATHFPESVPHTAFLRVPAEVGKPSCWTTNAARASHSNRYCFHCAALDEPTPPLSYLARKIVEDAAVSKVRRRQGWCASTVLTGHSGNYFVAAPREPDYARLNQRKTGMTQSHGGYVSPQTRVSEMNAALRTTRQQRREAAGQTLLTPFERPDAPPVFKMSNIDEWWGLDPVRVASEQVRLRQTLRSNPFSPLADSSAATKDGNTGAVTGRVS